MTTWFTGGLYIERRKVDVLDKLNKYVKADDTLWILGNVYGRESGCYAAFREALNCKNVNYIIGNFDMPNLSELKENFQKVKHIHRGMVKNVKMTICYYPMVWRPEVEKDRIHLYSDYLRGHYGEKNTLNVSFTNARKLLGKFKPFSFKDVFREIKKKNELIDSAASCGVRRIG